MRNSISYMLIVYFIIFLFVRYHFCTCVGKAFSSRTLKLWGEFILNMPPLSSTSVNTIKICLRYTLVINKCENYQNALQYFGCLVVSNGKEPIQKDLWRQRMNFLGLQHQNEMLGSYSTKIPTFKDLLHQLP